MNNSTWNKKRNRKKVLLIVEGNHEKNKLLNRILQSFPEINIDKDNILIYETNIYALLSKIVEEYGQDWYEQDIDIPYLFSKIKGYPQRESKRNYTNVLLIFDYERHDPNFSQLGIERMQEYFSNSEDMGKLYINYPMVESYMDLIGIEDPSYEYRKASSNMSNGNAYKNSVKNTFISCLVKFPIKIQDILVEELGVNTNIASHYINHILEAKNTDEINQITKLCLTPYVNQNKLTTFTFQLTHIINELGFLQNGESYNRYMRFVLRQIVLHNIKKANKIQNGIYTIEESNIKDFYKTISLFDILRQQNILSDPNGLAEIMVLNTSIFILPDYNTELVWNL